MNLVESIEKSQIAKSNVPKLQPGDTVQFAPVSYAEFIRLGGDDTPQEALA